MEAPVYVRTGEMTQGAVYQHLIDNHEIGKDAYDWDTVNVWEIHDRIDHTKTADHTHRG